MTCGEELRFEGVSVSVSPSYLFPYIVLMIIFFHHSLKESRMWFLWWFLRTIWLLVKFSWIFHYFCLSTYMVSQEHRKIAVEGISPNQFFPFSWFFKYTNPDQSSMLMTSRHALRCTWPVLLLVLGLGMLGCISAMACPILYQEMFAALSLKITSMFKLESMLYKVLIVL